ncbi:hypothetical protein ACH4LN_23495 [Streptomyces albus]|uniref:Uncharacterized protein n=1 Tax=Streptomyces albus TaxID=1888 RepID=A0A8H1LII4_9ACTN|nr:MULTISPECIES: hypothetical protein [Streptomyces]TGG89459.1 hypothetical protein D8771_00670 [Streptomyces albus]UVN57160.1 hypothetical protein NR995_23590 [Streptomyces albus]
MTEPLVTPASCVTWGLLKLRLGSGAGRVLVLFTEHGSPHVEPTWERETWGYPRPTLARVWKGAFPQAFWVSLAPRTSWVDVSLGHGVPAAGTLRRYLVDWRVCDPASVVRHQVTEGGAPPLIASHIAAQGGVEPGRQDVPMQPPPPLGTAPLSPYGQEHFLPQGIAYSLREAPSDVPDGDEQGPASTLPAAWGEAHREAYRFYRAVIADGPVGLAALWLLHQPDQAREVLEWTVAHRDVLRGADSGADSGVNGGAGVGADTDEDSWERSLAGLLRDLSEDERGIVGVHAAQVLCDIGVPQGEEVLRRLRKAPVPGQAAGQW